MREILRDGPVAGVPVRRESRDVRAASPHPGTNTVASLRAETGKQVAIVADPACGPVEVRVLIEGRAGLDRSGRCSSDEQRERRSRRPWTSGSLRCAGAACVSIPLRVRIRGGTPMYAVVKTGGKQLKVETGMTERRREARRAPSATPSTFTPLLRLRRRRRASSAATSPASTVTAEVVEHFKGDKADRLQVQEAQGLQEAQGSSPAADAHPRDRTSRSTAARRRRRPPRRSPPRSPPRRRRRPRPAARSRREGRRPPRSRRPPPKPREEARAAEARRAEGRQGRRRSRPPRSRRPRPPTKPRRRSRRRRKPAAKKDDAGRAESAE